MFDMVANIFKNLFSKPSTRLFPFVARESFKDTRGKLGDIKIEDCIFCGICERKCPSLAIKVERSSKTWAVNRYKCLVCGECVEVCPKKCLHMEEGFLGSTTQKTVDTFTMPPKPEDKEVSKTTTQEFVKAVNQAPTQEAVNETIKQADISVVTEASKEVPEESTALPQTEPKKEPRQQPRKEQSKESGKSVKKEQHREGYKKNRKK